MTTEWKPWTVLTEGPPCKSCRFWRPQFDYSGSEPRFVACRADLQEPDFSCFEAKPEAKPAPDIDLDITTYLSVCAAASDGIHDLIPHLTAGGYVYTCRNCHFSFAESHLIDTRHRIIRKPSK